MKTIDSLPPEVMHLILDPRHFLSLYPPYHVPKEYTKLRLVCQTFSAIISPHIFKHLWIKSSECSLQRLETIAESQHLKTLVKKYSYTLFTGRLPPSRTAQEEYFRLAADPSGLEDPDIIHSSKDPAMINIAHWLDQRNFELSNDLHELHVKHLTTLPNLTSISIEVPSCGFSGGPHDMAHMTGSSRSWGPVAFRAILLAIYNRTQAKNVTPLQNLNVEGISEECMQLPPSFVTKAVTGIRDIRHLKFSIRAVQDTSENTTPGWILLIGRLIQSVVSLESLKIEVQESRTDLYFRPLVTPYKSKLTPKPEIPLPAPRWPNLKMLVLNDLIFAESHLLNFITAHRKTLNHLAFNSCHLRPDSHPIKETDITQLDPLAFDPWLEFPVPINPWIAVFRTIHAHFLPHSTSALSHFSLQELWFDQPKQKRMHDCETIHWTKYITGEFDTEPSTTPDGHAEWCADCQDEEDNLDDDESSDDSDVSDGSDGSDDGYLYGNVGFDFGDDDLDSEYDDELEGMVGPPHLDFFTGFVGY